MADGSGQKSIKNTLLSGATGTNFFEEAAMLVPVPIVEQQEPAIAEIDLNSDDSSSNRGSIEKELPEQPTLLEESYTDPFDDKTAPISLFSRAATTGVDVFTRMLAGTSASKTEPVGAEYGVGSEAPAIAKFTQEVKDSDPVPQLPPVSNLFAPPAAAVSSATNMSAVTNLKPSTASTTVASDSNSNPVQFTPASSIFSSSSSSPLFPVGDSNTVATSFISTPNVPPAFFNPVTSPTLPSSTNADSFGRTAPLASVTSPISTIPSFGNNSSLATNPPPPLTTIPLSPSPGISTTPNTPPLLSGVPLSAAPGIPTTSHIPPTVPPFSAPGIATTPNIPPPASAVGSNTYRLGSQRMKYVPCPEMPAASPIQPLPLNTQNMVPPIGPPAPGPPSAFAPPSIGMGASTSYQTPAMPPSMPPPRHDFNASELGPRQATSVTSMANNTYFPPSASGVHQTYGPQELSMLTYHWFYRKDVDGKVVWKPFSIIDLVALEEAFANDPDRMVPTDGARYDVYVSKRLKMPVYWEEAPVEVRRGSWFFKGPMDNRFIPYEEDFALKLEEEYADCMKTGNWQKRLEFPEGESVIMHSAGVVVHFCQAAAPDDWGNLPESQIRPRVVKRGVEEIEVEDGESTQIDHLVFVVHGIGPICDFKLRNIVEAVDDFRVLSFQLLNSHFKESIEKNLVGRVEFLPVSWHKALHGDKGIDEQLKRITLRSIPKFRDFTNDTLLDILFYTSPVYCQTIINSVGSELNRIYKLFLSRNPSFKGKVSLTGHSLGSLILFDLLAHQPEVGSTKASEADTGVSSEGKEVEAKDVANENQSVQNSSSRTISYTVGNAGTGQPFINYPTIDFTPTAFFALGSPIAMFVTVRGIEMLGSDFRLPACPAFFNIFHPYDPVAYRIETMIDPNFQARAVLIPHHKGRKRIHLELKETMARVGADIKHRVIDAVKNTINTVYHYTGFNKAQENLECEIQSAIAGEMEKKSELDGAEDENAHISIGSLNGGRRIDYVLQEAPYETFNEYVFAMSTHLGYWESEDTMLLILSEIYSGLGIQKDNQIAGSQVIASPTHTQPPLGLANSLSFQSQTFGGNGNQYSSMPSSLQPSAPPYSDYQTQTGMNQRSFQPAYQDPVSLPAVIPPHNIPMMQPASQTHGPLLPPNPVSVGMPSGPTAAPTKPAVIGNRPVVDPAYFPQGMDPTAPMLSSAQVGPPPKAGFVRKN